MHELNTLLAEFEYDPLRAGRNIFELLSEDRDSFSTAALALLPGLHKGSGSQRLVQLLVERGMLLEAICDRDRRSVQEAAALLRAAMRLDPLIDAKVLRRMLAWLAEGEHHDDGIVIQKTLAVFDAAGLGNRLLPMLIQLLRKSDAHVRSKVALMLGRGNRQVAWAMEDPDPRVRANAVESLWEAERGLALRAFWKAAHDSNNRVAGNAVLGLLRLGEKGAHAPLEQMSTHRSPLFRATAAWVMGQSGDALFQSTLEQMMADPDEGVRSNAHRSLALLPRAQNHTLE